MIDGRWLPVRDADPRAVALYKRHYSADLRVQQRWTNGIGGPGERMVLLTQDCQALFIWRLRPESLTKKPGYDDGQRGVMCAVFRNEGDFLSSDLIREADELAWQRWSIQRHFTYVWDAKVRRKRDPGRCFRKAGWQPCGRNADGRLTILEIQPA